MSKKITIICSNYNSDRWIDTYLDCVNNQKGPGFDIIFLDAKSTDNSLNKIKSYLFDHKINKTIIELKERVGVYTAWNIGIKEANTPYVVNFNTDDFWYDFAIESYTRELEANPDADLIYSDCYFVDTRDINKHVGRSNWPDVHDHQILLKYCYGGCFPLVKKSAIERCGYFDENFVSSGDYEQWLKMSKKGCKFKKNPDVIGSFYFRPDSVHSSNEQKARQEDLYIQSKYR